MSEATELREPKTPFQRLVRELAEQAMSITHHDANEYEQGYIHEVDSMERKFGPHHPRGHGGSHTKPATCVSDRNP